MRFNMVLLSVAGFRYTHFLFDPARAICDALEELGHSCVISQNSLMADRINLLVASHTITDPAVVEQILDSGAEYVIIQSEVIREGQVNLTGDRRQFESCYLPLLRGARCVWEGVPGQLEILQSLGVTASTICSGWHRSMEVIRPKADKDIDFLFYGSISEHRRRMITDLEARGHSVVFCFDAPAMYRNDLIARARVHLAPRRAEDMHHLAYGRVLFLAANGEVVVVERCADQKWLEDCFLHADTSDWALLCEETAARSDLSELGATFRRRVQNRPLIDQIRPLANELSGGRATGASV